MPGAPGAVPAGTFKGAAYGVPPPLGGGFSFLSSSHRVSASLIIAPKSLFYRGLTVSGGLSSSQPFSELTRCQVPIMFPEEAIRNPGKGPRYLMEKRLTEAVIPALRTLKAEEEIYHAGSPSAGIRITRDGAKTFFIRYRSPTLTGKDPGKQMLRRYNFGEHRSGRPGEGRYISLKEFEAASPTYPESASIPVSGSRSRFPGAAGTAGSTTRRSRPSLKPCPGWPTRRQRTPIGSSSAPRYGLARRRVSGPRISSRSQGRESGSFGGRRWIGISSSRWWDRWPRSSTGVAWRSGRKARSSGPRVPPALTRMRCEPQTASCGCSVGWRISVRTTSAGRRGNTSRPWG